MLCDMGRMDRRGFLMAATGAAAAVAAQSERIAVGCIGVGNQGTGVMRNGRIGRLHTINVWSPGSRSGGSLEPAAVPAGLDYDLWLGPAPFTPYTKHRCTNGFRRGDPSKIWPFISDYCLGWVAGWGVHPLDVALWGAGEKLDPRGPIEIQGKGTFPAAGACDTATNWSLTIRYAGGITMNFTGQPAPAAWRKRYGRTGPHGTVFEGSEGWVHVDRAGINAHPKALLKSTIAPDEVRLYRSRNHVRNFLDCVKTRARTICPIDAALAVDTLCQLSAIAIRLARKLTWSAKDQRFINDDTANRLLRRAMRSPWHL